MNPFSSGTRLRRIKDIIVQRKGSLLLELQQRAIEFNSIIEKHQNIRFTLLERMPVMDETTYSGRRAGSLPASVFTSSGTPAKIPNGVAKPAAAAGPPFDLLDLSSDDTPVPICSPTAGSVMDVSILFNLPLIKVDRLIPQPSHMRAAR